MHTRAEPRRTGRAALIVALLSTTCGASAWADITPFLKMPDFDQRRAGLANDGNSHCVPTATVNMLAYVANHGFPGMMSGPRGWQLQSEHNFVSGNIFIMGGLMGTTGTGGTGGVGWENGLRTWVDAHAPGLFTVTRLFATSGTHSVNPDTIFDHLSDGSLVAFAYGRYSQPLIFEPPYERTGGHAVTAVQMVRGVGTWPTGYYRDPASDDGNLMTQSTFMSRHVIFAEATIPLTNGTNRTMWELHFDPPIGGFTRRFMDSLIILNPSFVLTPSFNLGISLHRPWRITGAGAPQHRIIPPPSGRTIAAAHLHADQQSALVVTGPMGNFTTTLWRLSLADGSYQQLLFLPTPQTPLALSRHDNDFYTVSGSLVVRVRLVPNVNGDLTPSVEERYTPGSIVGTLVYNDDADELVVLLPALRQIRLCPRLLGTSATTLTFPLAEQVPFGDLLTLQIGPPGTPVAGKYFLMTGGSVYELRRVGTSLVLDATLTPVVGFPQALSISDRGTLIVAGGGVLTEYEKSAAGAWAPCVGSLLTGLPAPAGGAGVPIVSLSRSRTNFDPALHAIPGWELIIDTIPGPEIPDCNADFNGLNGVTVQDLYDFLADWTAQSTGGPIVIASADYNSVDGITVQDLYDFLADWTAGCP